MLSNIQNQIDPEGKWQNRQSIGRADVMRTVNVKRKLKRVISLAIYQTMLNYLRIQFVKIGV